MPTKFSKPVHIWDAERQMSSQKGPKMSQHSLSARKRQIFRTVFEIDCSKSHIDNIHFSRKFESSNSSLITHSVETWHQTQWDAAWDLVTHSLSDAYLSEIQGLSKKAKNGIEIVDTQILSALQILLFPDEYVPQALNKRDIVLWYSSQVRLHFLNQALPQILRFKEEKWEPDITLYRSTQLLEVVLHQYHRGLLIIEKQIELSARGTSYSVVSRFIRDLNTIVSNSTMEVLAECISSVLQRYIALVLGLPSRVNPRAKSIGVEDHESENARRAALGLIEKLKNIGLAGERFQVIFAESMNSAVSEFVYEGFKDTWSLDNPVIISSSQDRNLSFGIINLDTTQTKTHSSKCVLDIREWVKERYTKLVVQVLGLLDNGINLSWVEQEKYKEMSIARLAALRTKELFNIIQSWPQAHGALSDLRTAITSTQRRLYLTENFSRVLASRVLHPAASTTHILKTYISIIRSFHSLDHSKVLLDRVAYPLQLYLSTREDTVQIIISSLLADIDEGKSAHEEEKLTELAHLLHTEAKPFGSRIDDEGQDWNDMEWIPDPVDAGPGYKRSKDLDILGTLVGDFGTQEVFIKEFQRIIAGRFLKYNGDFSSEIKVLELLKLRFGEAPLQACEVMLRDIQDSERLNGVIRRIQKLDPSKQEIKLANQSSSQLAKGNAEGLIKPSLHAKILSRLFWPELLAETYQIPDEVAELQKKYEEGFQTVKASRKLSWNHMLGHATIELELEDRYLVEEVHTWQAAVIWAFQSENAVGTSLTRSVQELTEYLGMDESVIRRALKFWNQKLILHELQPDTFTVLESLSSVERARSNNKRVSGVIPSNPDESDMQHSRNLETDGSGVLKEMDMYWQYIVGMLTNSASQMPLPQITMILKMLLVDGFPHSDEKLRNFLARKIDEGALELVAGKYRLKK
ncbi:BgtA-20816 [Blumeria graminis f. sp. tritici]|uniref:Anaphase-promoting complex subunit 2 n=3 Tax=Blumeria graminis f. sp. tritici TaxID=62690 RepID=A0A656KNA8_BLUGR|nr:hypothetical protein BGT96224_A20816 [Blumeria graminis f. sp. tritici 96224]VDB90899.1 BgtA-20816 [Blumeria graminis f. sp. tritici]